MINLTPEERATGRENYYSAVTAHDKMNRRDFIVRSIAAGGVTAAGVGGMYFGYGRPNRPVRVCVIGTGDEGSVLMGAINPDFVEVTAICDIRPSSVHRAFHGDWSTPNTIKVRPGLMNVYGWKTEDEARRNVAIYKDWEKAVQDPNIDGVIIATPLFLHAPIAVAAMKAGKHVLCEKLMAHNVAQCKLMTRTAADTNTLLSVGHQRHYSILYDNAVNLIKWGLLGEIHHIRAQWHRNNAPGKDSWALPIPGGEIASDGKRYDKIKDQLNSFIKAYREPGTAPKDLKTYEKQIAQWQQWDLDKTVEADKHGYIARTDVYDDRERSAIEEMVRWRLWDRTGGGLMAELGSHQLDAASIFISALSRQTGKHVHPLTVHAVGGRHIFPKDRDADDHVYCSFEFPGQGYDYNFDVGYKDKVNNFPGPSTGVPSFEVADNKKVVVTYSSINGNGFGGYGEVVLGTKGTLVLDREKEVMLYPIAGTSYKARVKKKGASAILDTSASGDAAPAKAAEGTGPVSRGYREEIEHWAWCISTGDPVNQPRCNGPVALADAVIALTAKQAIANSQKPGGNGFIQFQPGWFDYKSDEVPEADGAEATKAMWAKERKELGLA
ncbi:MAG: Gfo/Idh/MocA family oxidoreductase [Mariniblastus sp.]|nr:Gfo/Idh/MocA family oxidoreductase [Mariniblastus sp.]